jgi:hypothetical protein
MAHAVGGDPGDEEANLVASESPGFGRLARFEVRREGEVEALTPQPPLQSGGGVGAGR